jgi:phage terminase large subunit
MNQLILEGTPNKKQEEFFLSEKRHIAYGGARGGGKSWAMRRKFVLLCLRYPGLQCLLLRRTLPELRENHQLPLQRELYGFVKYNSDEKSFTFPNGSRIRLGYCDSESDVYQYQGQEYDVIGLEEATHFTESQKDFLITCNRSTRRDFKPRMYYTSNPGNVGHAWFKRLFIDREYRNNEKPEDYEFIQALVYDNDVLMKTNPEYVTALENLPEDMRKAMLYGDWNVFEGQFFQEFNSVFHVVQPFEIPNNWELYRTIDYGLDMCACYMIAQSPDNHFYVIDEIYEKDLIVSKAAEKILEMENKWLRPDLNPGRTLRLGVAPPDLWNRHAETGKSAADIFYENGVNWVKGNNDRINGWLALKEMIKLVESKNPNTGEETTDCQLKIFNTCTNLIRTLPQLQHDELKANDVAKQPHEITHAGDALRIFALYWISGGDFTYTNKPAKPKIKWTQDMIDDYNRGSEYIKERMIEKYGEINY